LDWRRWDLRLRFAIILAVYDGIQLKFWHLAEMGRSSAAPLQSFGSFGDRREFRKIAIS
jgi:hypothetical protein